MLIYVEEEFHLQTFKTILKQLKVDVQHCFQMTEHLTDTTFVNHKYKVYKLKRTDIAVKRKYLIYFFFPAFIR